jgi:thiamine biosynthesis protein ThiI
MDTTNRAIDMLVLRPLIGEDKLETIAVAEKIGTMELSAPQVPDSCTVFAPASPATSAPVDVIEKEEMKIPNYPQVLQQIIDEIEIIA